MISEEKDLSLLTLLRLYGFDSSCRAKLVRHKDRRYFVDQLVSQGWFEAYQQYQSKPVFDNLNFIVSFVGEESTRARFKGIYIVEGRIPPSERQLPTGCPHTEWLSSTFCYRLTKQTGFQALEDRMVIDWGSATRAWSQRMRDKPVLEIRPKGQVLTPFKDYLDFSLTYRELRSLVQNAEGNRDWKARLSAVAGIYLILAETTGHQYVGSATGAGGIWARWKEYAENGHGGNEKLKGLVESNPAYPDKFVYSILQILPRTTVLDEVLKLEGRYKNKLGSRATGLNAN